MITIAAPDTAIAPIDRVLDTLSPSKARILLVLVIASSIGLGLLATGSAASAAAIGQAGADLTRLMRAMAVLKVMLAMPAAAAIFWRLAAPATWPWLAVYALAGAGMAAGPGLIWDMVYIRSGALLLHTGLFGAVLLLWRDRQVGAMLGAMVTARRLRAAR
jgi:hypothetical protein